MSATPQEIKQIAGVWLMDEWVFWPAMYHHDDAKKWLELIADDHSFTFKTGYEKYAPNCRLPYGPIRT